MIERAASCEGCVLKGKGVETNQVVRKKNKGCTFWTSPCWVTCWPWEILSSVMGCFLLAFLGWCCAMGESNEDSSVHAWRTFVHKRLLNTICRWDPPTSLQFVKICKKHLKYQHNVCSVCVGNPKKFKTSFEKQVCILKVFFSDEWLSSTSHLQAC